jgi:hypothetical protein
MSKLIMLLTVVLLPAGFGTHEVSAQQETSASTRRRNFDRDPGWDGHNNRVVPKKAHVVKQDFGYSPTHFAGKEKGEAGGAVQRSTTPASYAGTMTSVSLSSRLTASGSFAITDAGGQAGVFFGFFNSNQPGGSGRPVGSLGLNFDFENNGARLAVRLITGTNKSCGTFITPYLPGKFRPTPLRIDGTRYHWTLDYDPHGANDDGQFRFTLRSDTHTTQDYGELPEVSLKEAKARFPAVTTFTVNLTPGFKNESTVFDRFGIHNMMKSGGTATIFFDDLQLNGRSQDFASDPGWTGAGNHASFDDREVAGSHDFGFSADTNRAGGAGPGEVGGSFWRSGEFASYADRVGPLHLYQPLAARGKVCLVTAGPDSDMYLGWFNSAANDNPGDAKDFIGIHVGGPTRIGHYFSPVLATSRGTKARAETSPVLLPGKVFDWSFVYDPAAEKGNGAIRVTLGDESVTLGLRPGRKAECSSLDRFGMFTSTIGGQMVKIYVDDLEYTAAPNATW